MKRMSLDKRMVLVVSAFIFAGVCGSGRAAEDYKANGGFDAPYFQADFYQNLSDFSSALVNPALLYRVNQLHADFGMYRWSSHGWGFQQLAFQAPIRRSHTAGVTLIGASMPIDLTEIRPGSSGYSFNPIGSSNFTDLWVVGNYGVRVMPWLMLGTNIKMRLQYQFSDEIKLSKWPGADIGIYLNPIDQYRFGDLGFSFNLQDIVPSVMQWGTEDVSYPVATRFRAGVRYAVLNDNLVASAEVVYDNAFSFLWKTLLQFAAYDTADSTWKINSEPDSLIKQAFRYGANLRWMFIHQIWLKAGWDNNNIPYLGLNVNLMYPLPEMINYLSADFHFGYSFIESMLLPDKKDERGFTFMSKFALDFGPTREQRESKRLYDKLILAPMNAYIEAMKLYEAGQYWLAGFAFGKVLSLFPNFHLNDKVTFYMGNCYRFLYMNDISRQMYQEGLEKYTTSEMRSKFLYGLMAIDYREEKYDDALKNHAFIVNLYPESDIRPDADYLAGEVHFARKNYNAAEQLFGKIKPKDPAYLYAQYTLAIINVENKKTQAAVQCLKKITEDTTQDESKQLLQDAANLKLGHLYYEEVELRQAVEAYKKVSEGSVYGDEALLGMAWSWIKANQPQVCDQVLDQLLATYPKSPLVPESYLLKGYANMLLKRYPTAKSILDECVNLCKGQYITDADLKTRTDQFGGSVNQFRPTEDNIKKNALRRPTDRTLEERTGMKSEFDKFDQENKNFFSYTLLAKSHKRFLKRKDEILRDAEYALAKCAALMGTQKTEDAIKKEQQKIQNIDEEMKKLQQQLKTK
jgi:tetratricopeptide (TPR) repeat protein